MKTIIAFWLLMLALIVRASAVEYSVAQVEGKRLTVCRVDLRKESLRLFLGDEKGLPLKRFDRLAALLHLRGEKLTFAMNAGMYHRDFTPVGLFVSEGKQSSALNTANAYGNFFLKPNGVFLVTERGAKVVETSQYPRIRERVILATQSGPMLVHGGKIHPAFKRNSDSRLFRNGVCAPTPDVAIFVNSEAPVSLYEFASFFRDTLRCTEALFLDGTINSLYSTELKRNDFRMDLGPIIGVSE